MRKTWITLLFMSLALPFVVSAKPLLNVDKYQVAIKGYDVVSYKSNQPSKGNKQWEHTHQGVKYRFANAENLELFKTSPDQYLPACGGWCAYAMLEGKKVEINPKSFKWIDNKLYLFYDGLWGDTLKMWNKKIGNSSNEQSLVDQVSAHWSKLKGN